MTFVGIVRGAFLVNRPQVVYFLQSSEMRHTHLAVVKIRFEMLHFKRNKNDHNLPQHKNNVLRKQSFG